MARGTSEAKEAAIGIQKKKDASERKVLNLHCIWRELQHTPKKFHDASATKEMEEKLFSFSFFISAN